MSAASEQKTETCAGCGVVEHFDLLDEQCINGEATGRLLCVRCDPHWLPAGDPADITRLTVAPELLPFYVRFLMREADRERAESDNVIILPVVAKPQALGGLDEVTLPSLTLPRRVHGRLMKLADAWDVPISAAASLLLIDKINEASGLRTRRARK